MRNLVYDALSVILNLVSMGFWCYALYKIIHGFKLTFLFDRHTEGQPWLDVRVLGNSRTSEKTQDVGDKQ